MIENSVTASTNVDLESAFICTFYKLLDVSNTEGPYGVFLDEAAKSLENIDNIHQLILTDMTDNDYLIRVIREVDTASRTTANNTINMGTLQRQIAGLVSVPNIIDDFI